MKSDELEQHVFSTYVGLRMALVLVALALPFLLWAGDHFLFDGPLLRHSISAYYDSRMRDVFCGLLFVVGICLYLYKGFTAEENYALNFSGALALGIAAFPHKWQPAGLPVKPHFVCAVLFFAGLAWVCWRRAADTLHLIQDPQVKLHFARKYKGIAIALLLSPLAAIALREIYGSEDSTIFWVEACAIYVFAYYWWTKSLELIRTRAVERAVKG